MLWLNKVGFKGRVKASPSGRLFIANCYPTVAKWPHTVDLAKMYTRNKKACWERSERWERKKHHRYRITDSSIFVRLITSICKTWHLVLVHRWVMQGQFFLLSLKQRIICRCMFEDNHQEWLQMLFRDLNFSFHFFFIWNFFYTCISYWTGNTAQRIIKDRFSSHPPSEEQSRSVISLLALLSHDPAEQSVHM